MKYSVVRWVPAGCIKHGCHSQVRSMYPAIGAVSGYFGTDVNGRKGLLSNSANQIPFEMEIERRREASPPPLQ